MKSAEKNSVPMQGELLDKFLRHDKNKREHDSKRIKTIFSPMNITIVSILIFVLTVCVLFSNGFIAGFSSKFSIGKSEIEIQIQGKEDKPTNTPKSNTGLYFTGKNTVNGTGNYQMKPITGVVPKVSF